MQLAPTELVNPSPSNTGSQNMRKQIALVGALAMDFWNQSWELSIDF